MLCPVWGSNSRPSDICYRLWDWRAAYCANEASLLVKVILIVKTFGWTILITKNYLKNNSEKNSGYVDYEQAFFIELN